MAVLALPMVKQARYAGIVILVIALTGCGRNERMDRLYAERCLGCHGALGRGDGPAAGLLPVRLADFRDTVQQKGTGQIRKIISEGRGMMPAFEPALRPAEISDMVQMVRFLSREGRDVSWWEKYDTLVIAHCSVPWDVVLGYDEETSVEKP